MKLIAKIFAAAAAAAMLVSPAYAGGYLKVGDIKGESAQKDHDKWVDVLSVDWGAHKPGSGASSEPGGTAVFTVKEDDTAVLIAEALRSEPFLVRLFVIDATERSFRQRL